MYRQSRCPRAKVSSKSSCVDDRAHRVVGRGAVLEPEVLAPQVHALVVRGVDVVGPEQADVAALERVLGRPAAEREIDVVRLDQLERRPAFEEEGRRRRLVQLGLGGRDLLEVHRRIARLEEDLRLALAGRGSRRRRCVRSSGRRRPGRRGWLFSALWVRLQSPLYPARCGPSAALSPMTAVRSPAANVSLAIPPPGKAHGRPSAGFWGSSYGQVGGGQFLVRLPLAGADVIA